MIDLSMIFCSNPESVSFFHDLAHKTVEATLISFFLTLVVISYFYIYYFSVVLSVLLAKGRL